jgi:hypothetical protein
MKRIVGLAAALILVIATQSAGVSPRGASASQVKVQGICLNQMFCMECVAAGGRCGTFGRQCYCFF